MLHRCVERIELPSKITLGKGTGHERTYDIISFFKKGEREISRFEMDKRIKALNVSLGREDRQYILRYQREIPFELRWNAFFLFNREKHPEDEALVAFVLWDKYDWICLWARFDLWSNIVYGLRRRR